MAAPGPRPFTASPACLVKARVEAFAASLGDTAELLHIQVHQLPGTLTFIADNAPRRPVELGEDGHAVAPEDAVDRRGSHAQFVGDPVWPCSQAAPQGQDCFYDWPPGSMGQAVGTATGVVEAREALYPVPFQPLCAGGA